MGVKWKTSLVVAASTVLLTLSAPTIPDAHASAFSPESEPVATQMLERKELYSPPTPIAVRPTAEPEPTVIPTQEERVEDVEFIIDELSMQPIESIHEEPVQEPPPMVTYCGENLALFKELYPEEYAAALEAHPKSLALRCLHGPAPADSHILDVKYYNQCEFKNLEFEGIRNYYPCAYGDGPTTLAMVLEWAGFGKQDIYQLFDELPRFGVTRPVRMEGFLEESGLLGEAQDDMSWEYVKQELDSNNLILIRTKDHEVNEERFCQQYCFEISRYYLITGYSEEQQMAFFHDIYTHYWSALFSYGEDVALNRETLEDLFTDSSTMHWTITLPEGTVPNSVPEHKLYTGDVTYCGTARALFAQQHPEEFAKSGAAGTGLEYPACTTGPPPQGAFIWDVPFYSQVQFGGDVPANGCGPTSIKMGAEFINNPQNIHILYQLFGTDETGTEMGRLKYVSRKLGIIDDSTEEMFHDMELENILAHLTEGHPIILNTLNRSYANQNYCLKRCSENTKGHYILIVGAAPGTEDWPASLVVHDPYASYPYERGRYLVLTWDTVEKIYQDRGRELILIPPTKE